jgi:hypothetical protein
MPQIILGVAISANSQSISSTAECLRPWPLIRRERVRYKAEAIAHTHLNNGRA